MSKINTTKYGVYGLLLLVILAFGGIPTQTKAQYADSIHIDGYGQSYPYYNNGYYNGNNNNMYGPQYYPYYVSPAPAPTPAPVDYSNVPTVYSTEGTNNASNSSKSVSKTVTNNNVTSTTQDIKPDNFNQFAASAILGSNTFMPSSIIGWLLLAVLILFLVILVRKIFGAKDAYHASPMKHS